MSEISKAVKKVDHDEKVNGSAKYVCDYSYEDMLYGALVRSTIPHGRVTSIIYPDLPDGYAVVDASDMPEGNYLRDANDGQQIFATDHVNYIAEAIAMICGPDEDIVRELVAKTKVIYDELPAVCTVEEATDALVTYHYIKSDVEDAFAKAVRVYKEDLHTGYQEQMYLEPNGMLAIWKGNKMVVYGSMQNPYYVKNSVMGVLGLESNQVQVKHCVTGGGFGGKEDYPSLLAVQAAAASMKLGKPVKVILKRKEDVADTPKRHPTNLHYEVALDETNQITGMKIEIVYDGGAYQTVSATVMQRSMITCIGVYNIPSLQVDGRVMMTNKVPTGAYRGFGAPQTHFAVETLMNHIAAYVNEDSLTFKKKHLAKQGDLTSTSGIFHYPIILPDMIDKAIELTDYENKREKYKNQSGRFHKGIGMGLSIHGCGFTGSAEKDFLKSVASLQKYKDGSVEILASNSDMGQGVKTTFSKIVAKALEIPLSKVTITSPDTDRVPNSGPTVASRSIMIVGKLLEDAARELKDIWEDGKEQKVVRHYKHPENLIPWCLDDFTGDPYPTYSWGVNVIEVELDMLTGESHVVGGCGVYDVGTAIDERIMKGQIEGGMLQGIGYASMEKMVSVDGRIAQCSFTDYMVPTSMDIAKIQTFMMDNLYENGPFGAKGAGELTLLGSGPAFVQAMEQAGGCQFSAIPVTPEQVIKNQKR